MLESAPSSEETLCFYGKSKCVTNLKQRRLLENLGVEYRFFDLLKEPWTPAKLEKFVGNKPINECLNPTAPAVKSGQLDLNGMSRESLILRMCKEPVLIRRPLLVIGSWTAIGFDWSSLRDQLLLKQLLGPAEGNKHSDTWETCDKESWQSLNRCSHNG